MGIAWEWKRTQITLIGDKIMKIRNGFVSNSSSASFIVNIHDTTIQEVCEMISEHFTYSYFSKVELINKLNSDINNLRGIIELDSCNSSYWTEKINKFRKILNLLSNDLNKKSFVIDENIVLDVLKDVYGINMDQKDNIVTLEASTSMYNDIKDVPEILRDIIAYYNFEIDKKINCEIESV